MSAEKLELAINALNTVVAAISGIRRTYVDPPESISEFPSAMTYIDSGVYMAGPAQHGNHILILDIYEARQVLAQAVDSAKQWPDKVRTALTANLTLNDTVSHVGDATQFFRYRAMPMPYNDQIHYGVRFWIPAKVNY